MISYNKGKGSYYNWIISEDDFTLEKLGKCETIMALGNGYMGSRFTFEEDYLNQIRDTFVNGTFNKFSDNEVTELPNLPDLWGMEMYFDGYRFTLEKGEILSYERDLNLKDGNVTRNITWKVPNGKIVTLNFQRFISYAHLHTLGNRIVIKCDKPIQVIVKSGINGQYSNSGSQHLDEVDMRFFEKKFLQFNVRTTQSKIGISLNTTHIINGTDVQTEMLMDRRTIKQILKFEVNKEVSIDKISVIYTEIDKDVESDNFEELKKLAYKEFLLQSKKGFLCLLEENKKAWKEQVWDQYPIIIDSENPRDQLAIRFAIYHLTIMTPKHDNRMGIGAKGLTGEGYKGHSFWDTEVFMLPFFVYSNPKVARSLLEYRYLGLEGARKKAKENGYEGAMYPWEAAWPSDGEVTPVWGAVDIVTGEQTKIWSGFIEQHITGDIANAVWQYYIIANDQEFMDKYGYEILFETANFWASRLEYNEGKERYEINDVIGPDEYKEHVDNNAFTNYIAMHNMKLAKRYYEEIKRYNKTVYECLNQKLLLDESYKIWIERMEKLYLPSPNEKGIIPQDDTYLTKKEIDLTFYKQQEQVASLFKDYNLEQVNQMQISKQADVMILFYLLEDLFSDEVKVANYNYYEPKTMHDSSLSLSTHCILANDLEEKEKAYDLFKRASEIDMGSNMSSSDHGIHAASLGGIWQCVVMGFAGVRMLNEKLRINPKLPKHWNSLSFDMYWKGNLLHVFIDDKKLHITSETEDEIQFTCKENTYHFQKGICVTYV